MDWQHLLLRFDGRINRAKFWSGVGALIVAYIVIFVLFAIDSSALRALLGVAYLAMIWPSLAISIKRWHDRDKSGWWVLIGLVPVIGGIWALVETGFLAGTSAPNQYGPDPLGRGVADQPAM
ncbi:MAG: DUF805 domain-containing protein [Acidobacteria bacterium]|nr:DUF805 domain-containing protein [Acidobacteriota bacterium]